MTRVPLSVTISHWEPLSLRLAERVPELRARQMPYGGYSVPVLLVVWRTPLLAA